MQHITSAAVEASSVEPPPASFNAASWLLGLNAGRGDRIAYVDERERIDFRTLDARVRRCAAGWRALGLVPGDRVVMVMLDGVDWPVAFLAAIHAGVVPVPVNTLLTTDDYRFLLADSDARALLVSAALLPTVEPAIDPTAGGPVLVVAGATAAGAPSASPAAIAFDTLLDAAPAADPAASRADETAFWLYSSGSTGRPKGTLHTHAALYWTAELYGRRVLGLREDDVGFSAAKLFFAYGLGNALTFPLAVGATTVLMAERPTPAAVFRRWREHGVTVFFGAPTGYAGMLAAPDLPARNEVRLRLCSSAGEALPADLGERFGARFGCEIVDGLGSTEMLHVFLSNRPGAVRYGTTGSVVPGYRCRVVDEDGAAAAPGAIGDLLVSGPSAATMYWQQPEKTRATFQGDWVRTGDKYRIDPDGRYVYAGRSDDMLKVSGVYVSPFEVEATLMQHPAVLECAVIGVPDADGLTKTKAFVVALPGREPGADALKAFVRERLAPFKVPRTIAFLDELPKTATGKIQRFRLREREGAAGATG